MNKFAKFLWGDVYYEVETRKFFRESEVEGRRDDVVRSFVYFVMEPIYKVFTKTMTGDAE